MISSERFQNIIILTTIIITIISTGFMISNGTYYGGSYILAGNVEAELTDIHVSHLDPSNASEIPAISLSFHVTIPVQAEGNVRITFFGATVWLNGIILSLTPFAYEPAIPNQYLYSDYNKTIIMSKSVPSTSHADQQTLFDAYQTSTWAWNVTLRYSFIIFDDRDTIMWRRLYYYTTDTTIN